MGKVVAIGYLLVCSGFDFKWKSIPAWILGVGGVIGVLLWILRAVLFGNIDWLDAIAGLIPGICVTALAWISSDRIGLGDGLVLLIVGLLLGLELTVISAIIGLFVATLFGVCLIIAKKATMQTAMPFIPFLAVGLGLALLI